MRKALAAGASVRAFDPVALENLAGELPEATRVEDMYEVLDGADALVICTEWNEFRTPDFPEISRRLAAPVIFDGRNLYRRQLMEDHGFVYLSVGRPAVRPASANAR